MATIKEVAKLAGVSVGTVSNVLNGKTSNAELIDKVENAIQKLSYRPDANARSLKNTKSRLIGVLMPEIAQSDHVQFLSKLESLLREKGYGILLKVSNNNSLLEKKNITQCMEQCVDGIIWYSPSRKNVELSEEQKKIPFVIVSKFPLLGYEGDLIQINYRDALEDGCHKMEQLGIEHTGFLFDSLPFFLDSTANIHCPEDSVKIVDGKERAFQAAYELLYQNPKVQGIIAGNNEIAKGIERALRMLEREDVHIFCCMENQWADQSLYCNGHMSVSQSKIAEASIIRLIDAIEKPYGHECHIQTYKAEFEYDAETPYPSYEAKVELKFALFDSPAARGLQMFSRIYQDKTGVQVSINLLNYSELENLLLRNARDKCSEYDGYMIDISWLEEAVESGGIQRLTDEFRDASSYLDGFIDGMVQEYGTYKGELYALPFMSGTQVLLYQKDLFEDPLLKRQFFRNYAQELLPPVNWAQFNLISEFFTREYNSHSPIRYGNLCIRGENVYNSIGFLNRLWSYDADLFDQNGNPEVNKPNALAALKSYIKSFQYSPADENITSWDDVVSEYCKGDTAMTVIYDSHAMEIGDYTKSKVAGNLGSLLIPGGVSVLGGWSLGLNSYGKKKKETLDYLKWICSDSNSIPLSLLGGSTLRRNFYRRSDMEDIYPWKKQVLVSYEKSRKRRFIENVKGSKKNEIYTRIIPHEINRVLHGEISEEEALVYMEKHMRELM